MSLKYDYANSLGRDGSPAVGDNSLSSGRAKEVGRDRVAAEPGTPVRKCYGLRIFICRHGPRVAPQTVGERCEVSGCSHHTIYAFLDIQAESMTLSKPLKMDRPSLLRKAGQYAE